VDFGGVRQVANLPGPDGVISFREAVTAANNTIGPQRIEFAIPKSTFWLGSNMALLKVENAPGGFTVSGNATTIDFTSQTRNIGDTNPGGNEVGIFGLMGNFTLPQAAITVTGSGCIIRGLDQVQNFGYGVLITGSRNHVVGCHFFEPFGGLVFAGVAIRPFTATPATANWIGGTGPGDGNVIATSPGVGVEITGPASNNMVVGNTLTRSHVAGLLIQGGATNTRVGGTTIAERNVISGNGTGGGQIPQDSDILMDGVNGTIIEGNFLGTTSTGVEAAVPPAVGIEMHGCSNTSIARNVISGYLAQGIHEGRPFRTGIGIFVTTGQGGVPSTDTRIQGNQIGVGADGTTSLPNAEGVRSNTGFPLNMRVLIGGAFAGQGNVIANNAGTGIVVGAASTGVTISRNSIFNNGAPNPLFPTGFLGIDLLGASGVAGVTANDLKDPDNGGNGLQNFPIIRSLAVINGATVIGGTLNSLPNQGFVIEIFSSPVRNALGHGEGKTFLGSVNVLTDANGNASFSRTIFGAVTSGDIVSATATQIATGNTSEFSASRVMP